jgi:diguanylate cyclase (GGDEF)-like protein
MQRIRSKSLRLSILLFAIVLAVLTAGTWAIQKYTIEHLLYRDAVASGRDWATYLAQNVDDLEQIARGERPSAGSMTFFARVQKVGRVFRYKIFDPNGRLRLVSDELHAVGTDKQNLTEHNAAAARAIAAGQPLVMAKTGKPPNRPPYFSEAYVPVIVGGRTLAIVEAYVDQTEKRELFNTALSLTALSLALLMVLSFAVPATAWYWRTREKQRADAHIDFLAHHDALTGLANRARVTELLRDSLARLPERGLIALHHVNVDRFKDVNDTLGHAAGDQIIEAVARRLRRVAGERDVLARIGGDEFVLVQVDLMDKAIAEQRAAAIARAVREPIAIDGHRMVITASIGVAIAPHDGESVARLMKSADLALDRSKAEGRDRVSFFSAALDAELHSRLAIEQALREGIERNWFELHFQPLYDLPQRQIAGFEALLRLRAPGGGYISPAAFIPVAEDMGLIGRIGAWALQQACRAATDWPESLRVSVNLSPAQFAGVGVCDTVATALATSGLPAHRLEIEITESLLLHDTDAVLSELHKLKKLGVAIAMDDFGTGYSSLSYLWRFPFDKIKIDQAFMAAYGGDDRNVEQVIRTIVALGRSLELRITVEGVENERQLRFVEALRCDQAQGFFFSRPIPAPDVAPYILAEFRKSLPAAAPDAAQARLRG